MRQKASIRILFVALAGTVAYVAAPASYAQPAPVVSSGTPADRAALPSAPGPGERPATRLGAMPPPAPGPDVPPPAMRLGALPPPPASRPQRPPPPPRHEHRPPPPARHDYAWHDGHWRWRNSAYVWTPGRWVVARPGWRWIPGRWAHSPTGWNYIEGQWAR